MTTNRQPSPTSFAQPEPKTRGCFKIAAGLIVALIVYVVWDSSSKKARAKEEHQAQLSGTMEGRIQIVAEEALGALKKFEANKITGGEREGLYNVDVTFEGGIDDKRSIENKFRDGFEKLFKSGLPIWEIWLRKKGKLIDKFGTESDQLIYKVSMTKETAARINWGNKLVIEFPSLWEPHFIHPALLKD